MNNNTEPLNTFLEIFNEVSLIPSLESKPTYTPLIHLSQTPHTPLTHPHTPLTHPSHTPHTPTYTPHTHPSYTPLIHPSHTHIHPSYTPYTPLTHPHTPLVHPLHTPHTPTYTPHTLSAPPQREFQNDVTVTCYGSDHILPSSSQPPHGQPFLPGYIQNFSVVTESQDSVSHI